MIENPNEMSRTPPLPILPATFAVGVTFILLHFTLENPFVTVLTAAQAGDMEFLLPLLGIAFL